MVRVSARCNAIPLTKWFVAWKRSRPLRVWQYRLQGILSLATVALGRRECYKTEEPPISERPVSSLVVNAVWRGMLQNEQIVTSAEGRHQRRSAAVGRLPVADVGVNHRI